MNEYVEGQVKETVIFYHGDRMEAQKEFNMLFLITYSGYFYSTSSRPLLSWW